MEERGYVVEALLEHLRAGGVAFRLIGDSSGFPEPAPAEIDLAVSAAELPRIPRLTAAFAQEFDLRLGELRGLARRGWRAGVGWAGARDGSGARSSPGRTRWAGLGSSPRAFSSARPRAFRRMRFSSPAWSTRSSAARFPRSARAGSRRCSAKSRTPPRTASASCGVTRRRRGFSPRPRAPTNGPPCDRNYASLG